MFAFLNSRGGNDNTISEQLNSGQGAETVVVVARNINVGDRITADMLATRTMPAAALVDGHFKDSDAQSLVGQVAVAPLYAGEQVLSSKVTSYEAQGSLTWKVPEGMRALSLTVPHEAWINAGLPRPGDHVDVVGVTTFITTDPLTGEQKPNLLGGYVAQDVEVLAVAQTVVKTVTKVKDGKPESGAASGGAVGVEDGSTYEKAVSITLALPPDLVAKVAMLDALKDDAGQYRIVTRQKGDTTLISGKTAFSFEDLFPVKK